MAVGNVGEKLAPYDESDTFLSRDAGFTWEEVHKDAHLWEFGDSGSILVMVNDEQPTDYILFSTDEGLNWREYKFSKETSISRRSQASCVRACGLRSLMVVDVLLTVSPLGKLDMEDPGHDDFELWSPSEERAERCLFGRQVNKPHHVPHPELDA